MSYQHIKITCTHVDKEMHKLAQDFKNLKIAGTKVKFDTYRAGMCHSQEKFDIEIEATKSDVFAILKFIEGRRCQWEEVACVRKSGDGYEIIK